VKNPEIIYQKISRPKKKLINGVETPPIKICIDPTKGVYKRIRK